MSLEELGVPATSQSTCLLIRVVSPAGAARIAWLVELSKETSSCPALAPGWISSTEPPALTQTSPRAARECRPRGVLMHAGSHADVLWCVQASVLTVVGCPSARSSATTSLLHINSCRASALKSDPWKPSLGLLLPPDNCPCLLARPCPRVHMGMDFLCVFSSPSANLPCLTLEIENHFGDGVMAYSAYLQHPSPRGLHLMTANSRALQLHHSLITAK